MASLSIMRLALTFALLICTNASTAFGLNPSRNITQYSHAAWRVQDGALGGPANAILQGPDGYIWIGTEAGLYKFDGIHFTACPGGPTHITTMSFDSTGRLWLGTPNGLFQFEQERFKPFPKIRGWINRMRTDSSGNIWLTRSRAQAEGTPVCEIQGDDIRCTGANKAIFFPTAAGLAIDSSGTFWFGNFEGLIRWKNDRFTLFAPEALKSGLNLSGVRDILPLSDGSLLIGIARSGRGLGLQQFSDERWKPFAPLGRDATKIQVEILTRDREGALWIGTLGQGLYRVFGDRVEHFDHRDGLSSDTVSDVYEDTEGNLWIATAEGIDCLRSRRVISFTRQEGLGSDFVQSVLARNDGSIWVGNSDSLDVLSRGGVSIIGSKMGLPGKRVTSMAEDARRRLWVGIDNDLYIYDSKKFSRLVRPDGQPIGTVIDIVRELDGSLWAICIRNFTTELVRFKDSSFSTVVSLPSAPRILAANPLGGVVICFTDSTCARYQSGGLAYLDMKLGPVNTVQVEEDGSAWFATTNSIYWNNSRTNSTTKVNGLPCDGSYSLQLDQAHDLWSYSPCGLNHISSTEVRRWKGNSTVRVSSELLDTTAGALPGKPNFGPASTLSSDGRLWFANGHSVQLVDPNEPPNIGPIPTHIESLIADRRSVPITTHIRIPPRTRELEIDYTGLSFVVPQKLAFRYELEGYDGAWQDVGTRRQVFFNDLPPGDYTFRVTASGDGAIWNSPAAVIHFVVLPAWHQTRWFHLLVIISVLLAAWLGYTYRVRGLAAAMRLRFDERLSERNRLVTELHDTLLQTIQGSKMVADDALADTTDASRLRPAMETLSKWLTHAIEQGRAALNALHASSTQTTDLADAFRRGIDDCLLHSSMTAEVRVHGVPKDMHPVVRDEVYRIGNEAIRNACHHSGGHILVLTLDYGSDLVLRIADNGHGIPPDVATFGMPGHYGIPAMRERASRIGATLDISTSATGTSILLRVPGRHFHFID